MDDLPTPVTWQHCANYEKDETVQYLRDVLTMPIFRRDDASVVETHQIIVAAGAEEEVTNSLVLSGTASTVRALLYDRLVANVRRTVSDFSLRVDFCLRVGDRLPEIEVETLVENTELVAMRYWMRMVWAMRCGILRKIGEARAIAQLHRQEKLREKGVMDPQSARTPTISPAERSLRLDASQTIQSVEGKLNATQVSSGALSRYHQSLHSTAFDVRRFAVGHPALFFGWASWDSTSVAMMEEQLFNAPQRDDATDPWEQFFVQHSGTGQEGPFGDSFVSVPSVEFAPAIVVEKPPALKGDGAKVHRRKSVTIARTPHAPPAAALGKGAQQGAPSRRRTVKPVAASVSRTVRLGTIVLISFDANRDAALAVIHRLQRRCGFWTSKRVSMVFAWGGPDGLHCPFATAFRVASLPYIVLVARTAPTESAPQPGAPPVAVIAIREPNAFVPRRKSVVRHFSIAEVDNVQGLPPWHAIPKADRQEAVSSILHFLRSCEAPLVFESRVARTYPLEGARRDFTDSSQLLMKGSICSVTLRPMVPLLGKLCRTVRNFDFDVMIFAPSHGIRFPFNPREAEHCVYGWKADVTCASCGGRILVDREWHYHCTACKTEMSSVCQRCAEAGLHPASHILAKVPLCETPFIPTIWGPGNIAVLPTLNGRLVSSTSNAHLGAYCKVCQNPLLGCDSSV